MEYFSAIMHECCQFLVEISYASLHFSVDWVSCNPHTTGATCVSLSNEIIWDKNLDNQSFDCRRGKHSINITITLHFMLLSWQCFLYWVISYLKTWKDTGWIIQFISHTHCHWGGNIISAFSHCVMAHVLSYFSQWHINVFVAIAVFYHHYHYYDCYDYH